MDGDAGIEAWTIVSGGEEIRLRQCPRRLITSDSLEWLQLYAMYKAGFLLVAGGVLNQPAIYNTVMTAIDSMVAEAQKQS